MKKFVKITTRNSDGSYAREWIDINSIIELAQRTNEEAGNNEGTVETVKGATIKIIDFNATIESLS
jgi:hypothetical protein